MANSDSPTKLHKGRYATCIACVYFSLHGVGGGCDTCGWGGEPSAECSKLHWSLDPTDNSDAFAEEIDRAQTCNDFKGRQ